MIRKIARLESIKRAFGDTVRSAFRSLRANKLRSALTLLGIVIGIVAVVAMSATTEGLRRQINRDLSQLGSGVFQIQKWPTGFGNHDMAKYEKRKNLTIQDVRMLQERCSECLLVAGEAWTFGQNISTAQRVTRSGAQVAGGTIGFFANNGYTLASGRLFTEADESTASDIAVLGSDVVDLLFPDYDPIGSTVRVQGRSFRVIGTLEHRGAQLGGGSLDNLIVLPLNAFLPLYGQNQSLNVTVQVRDPEKISRAQDEAVAILRKSRGVAPQDENDFEMFSNQSMQEMFEQMSGSIAAASIGICAIALLIGGIGVMNIMLVSVTERTAEIGIRRALGARRRRILGQFVVEAITLTSVGGLLGVFGGSVIAALIRIFFGLPTVVPVWAVTLAMITAASTGLVFGIYPAYRASRLDPVEAMRYE